MINEKENFDLLGSFTSELMPRRRFQYFVENFILLVYGKDT